MISKKNNYIKVNLKSVAFSHNGKYIATAGSDKKINLIDFQEK